MWKCNSGQLRNMQVVLHVNRSIKSARKFSLPVLFRVNLLMLLCVTATKISLSCNVLLHYLAKKISLLKHGRIDIVQCLRDLPRTRHHPGAFSVDVIKATVSLHLLVLCTKIVTTSG